MSDQNLSGEEILAPLRDLYRAVPTDPAACTQMVERHCFACRAHSQWPELEKVKDCYQRRCTLRDPVELVRERQILVIALDDLRDPNNAADEDVETLNSHIALCGSLTVGLGPRVGGYRRIAYEGTTLRAVLHRSIVLLLAWRAGERIHLNVNAGNAGELEGVRHPAATVV